MFEPQALQDGAAGRKCVDHKVSRGLGQSRERACGDDRPVESAADAVASDPNKAGIRIDLSGIGAKP